MTTGKKGGRKAAAKESHTRPGNVSSGPVTTPAGSTLPKGAQTGTSTATGQAMAEHKKEIPKGKEGGNKAKIVGAPTTGDLGIKSPAFKPQGLQAEPAQFAVNGSIEAGMLPSNSGPVPAAALHNTAEAAEKALADHKDTVEKQIKHSYEKLSHAKISRMSRAELQSVGHDRGYDIPQNGARVTRAAFVRMQDEDELAVEGENE